MPYLQRGGYRIFYREQGQGPLLLILPGNTASSAHHLGELAYFGQRFSAVAVDFRGTGQSDRLAGWPADWYQQAAQDAAALASTLQEKPARVMGTSGGAVVALWMAILNPTGVRCVVADSTVERFPPDWMVKVLAERARHTDGQVEFWQQGHGEDWEQVVTADSAMMRLSWGTGASIFADRLGEIACPVLLTGSLSDTALPDVGTQLVDMAQQISNSQLYLYKHGGHPLMWSQAGIFRQLCDNFLSTVGEAEG